MKKLIKLKEHFYIVDDSVIEKKDWVYIWMSRTHSESFSRTGKIGMCSYVQKENGWVNVLLEENNEKIEACEYDSTCLKITHSTKELEGVILLNTSDIEEVVYGYSIEKMGAEILNNIQL